MLQGLRDDIRNDGYVFNPALIFEDTRVIYIAFLMGHYHYIPPSDLSASELAAALTHLVGEKIQPRVLSYISKASVTITQSVAKGSQLASQNKSENISRVF